MQDDLMKPSAQMKLAEDLKAKKLIFESGHMGNAKEKIKFLEGLWEHLKTAVEG